MTAANREHWLRVFFEVEGGVSAHFADKGGLTNRGITQKTLSGWLGRQATDEEVRTLSEETARDILSSRYWAPVRGDDMPGGLDLYLADFAAHSGPTRAVRELQACLKSVEIDGYCGKKTVSACRVQDTATVLDRLHAGRLAFLKDLSVWEHFGKGWEARCNRVHIEALQLIQPNVVEAKVPTAVIEGGITAATVAAIVELLPQLIASGQQGYDAVSAGQWTVVATVVATAVGMGIRAFVRLRAHYRAGGA